jgi:hypothetical protein
MFDTLCSRLKNILCPLRALQLAKETGWFQRQGKISPFQFLFSAWGQASARELTLDAQASTFTEPVSRQAVDQRYTPEAVEFFKAAFAQILTQSLEWKVDHPMTQALQKIFPAIRLFDSTHCPCSDSLAQLFPGFKGAGGSAGIKILLSYEYGASQLHPLAVLPANCSEQSLADTAQQQIGPGELGIMDKGFYRAAAFRQVQARGGYFLIPWHHQVTVWEENAQGECVQIEVAAELKVSTAHQVQWEKVELGQTEKSRLGPVRVVAYRLREEAANRRRARLRETCRTRGKTPSAQALELAGWLILVTNAPAALLPADSIAYLYRVRWQIELLFKQWKSVLRIHVLKSTNPNRVQCEIWARLINALLVSIWHQHANAACLQTNDREISFLKAAKQLQQQGQVLVQTLFRAPERLKWEWRRVWKLLLKLAQKQRQLSRLTTWQLLCAHLLNEPTPIKA